MNGLKLISMSSDDFPERLITVSEFIKMLETHCNSNDALVFTVKPKFGDDKLCYFTGATIQDKIGTLNKMIAIHTSETEPEMY